MSVWKSYYFIYNVFTVIDYRFFVHVHTSLSKWRSMVVADQPQVKLKCLTESRNL